MSDFDYKAQLEQALMAVQNFNLLATGVDFSAIIAAMERADTVGSILDPTLWLRSYNGLKSQRRIIEAAAKFKASIDRQVADESEAVA